ncbi:MAG TPA: helix-turn-helix domain-containing protein [Candidatus Mediterraneibacter norwichensis]|mgnify:FL=1|nr:helix-turn-helix domain-containing protein [Candidatus Mediterraneibacter norwichensis]
MFETYDDILTIADIAEILKIGTTQAYKIVRSGQLKAYKEGKDWKITKHALIKYVLEQSHLHEN